MLAKYGQLHTFVYQLWMRSRTSINHLIVCTKIPRKKTIKHLNSIPPYLPLLFLHNHSHHIVSPGHNTDTLPPPHHPVPQYLFHLPRTLLPQLPKVNTRTRIVRIVTRVTSLEYVTVAVGIAAFEEGFAVGAEQGGDVVRYGDEGGDRGTGVMVALEFSRGDGRIGAGEE